MNSGIIGKRVEFQQHINAVKQEGIVMCLCENNTWFLICDDQLELHRVRYDMLTKLVLDMKFEEVEKEKIEE